MGRMSFCRGVGTGWICESGEEFLQIHLGTEDQKVVDRKKHLEWSKLGGIQISSSLLFSSIYARRYEIYITPVRPQIA
jgi:hypothetical protein